MQLQLQKEIIMLRCNIDKDALSEEWPSIRYECNRAGRTRASNDKIKEERRLKKQRKFLCENDDSDDDIYQSNKNQQKMYIFMRQIYVLIYV
jgi:hypothetical protein